MREIITSAKNQQLKNVSALLKSKKERDEQGVFVVEGLRIFMDAINSASELVEKIYMSETFYNTDFPVIAEKNGLSPEADRIEIVKDSVFDAISGTVSPQGILCVVKKPEHSLKDILNASSGKYLLLENIQDPGNLGTMVRTAEAAGISGIILSRDTADIFNPKVTRATMGSIFRVPFVYCEDFTGAINELKKNGIDVYAAYLHGGRPYGEIAFPDHYAIMIGNEGNGLTDEAVNSASERVFIPMQGQIESLNAAIAAAVLMFH